jgi:hypothetical protein
VDEFTIDFETFYDADYSLSKMQTEAYIEDPRFETILFSIAKGDAPPVWFRGPDAPAVFSRIAWDNAAVRCHHTQFDGLILEHRYGVRPAQWKDTLAQGRMLRPWMRSHSLASMAKAFHLPDKGTEVTNALGKRLADFTPAELERYAAYCMHDTVLTRTMGMLMDTQTPPLAEYLIDMTVRMFTEPALVGNVPMMARLHQQEIDRKAALLASAAIDKSIIMSGDKLAAALLTLGVVAPRKISATTKKETWAFAKTDKAFSDLLEHDDPQVQALVAARLGVKSTIAETRALTYHTMAKRGPLRVYLGFWGAKTTGRYSGGNKCLAGDTVITVLRDGEVLDIQLLALTAADLVWDGIEFVPHGGLVYQGTREVITHDCVTGTPDHKVYCEGMAEPVELVVAAEQGLVLQSGGVPRSVALAADSVPVREGPVYERA